MTLKEKVLSELKLQNEINQSEIKRLEEDISADLFIINSGTVAGPNKSAWQNRMQISIAQKDRIKNDNAWICEMLSKYE